jgi:hypothetical protein
MFAFRLARICVRGASDEKRRRNLSLAASFRVLRVSVRRETDFPSGGCRNFATLHLA